MKIQKDYKIKTVFILLEVGDGTVRPPVQMFVQNCFLGLDYWCKAATKNHCWLLNIFFFSDLMKFSVTVFPSDVPHLKMHS